MYHGAKNAKASKFTLCPSEKKPEGNWVGTFYGANDNIISGYEKNNTSNWMSRGPGRVGSFPIPSKVALIVENYGHGSYYLNVTYSPGDSSSNQRAAAFRHTKKCNVVFVDGHVANMTESAMAIATNNGNWNSELFGAKGSPQNP
jgi:prepilin-type processing-associated H-X9-DG protein